MGRAGRAAPPKPARSVAIPLCWSTVSRSIGIITRKGLPLRPAAREMLDLVIGSLNGETRLLHVSHQCLQTDHLIAQSFAAIVP